MTSLGRGGGHHLTLPGGVESPGSTLVLCWDSRALGLPDSEQRVCRARFLVPLWGWWPLTAGTAWRCAEVSTVCLEWGDCCLQFPCRVAVPIRVLRQERAGFGGAYSGACWGHFWATRSSAQSGVRGTHTKASRLICCQSSRLCLLPCVFQSLLMPFTLVPGTSVHVVGGGWGLGGVWKVLLCLLEAGSSQLLCKH